MNNGIIFIPRESNRELKYSLFELQSELMSPNIAKSEYRGKHINNADSRSEKKTFGGR